MTGDAATAFRLVAEWHKEKQETAKQQQERSVQCWQERSNKRLNAVPATWMQQVKDIVVQRGLVTLAGRGGL